MKEYRLCAKSAIAMVFIIGLMMLAMSFVFGMSCQASELTTPVETTPPLVITGLIANDTHDGKIDLTWIPSDADNFAYYAIYVSEIEITDVTGLSPIGQINDRVQVTYQATRYRVSGLMLPLVDDTQYWFAVTAVDLAGNENKVVISISATSTKIEVTPPSLIPTVEIVMDDSDFRPATVTVAVGTTVTWTNVGINCSDCDTHTVTSDTGLFGSGHLTFGDTFSYTFTQLGVFGYHCQFKPWLTGKVIVE